MAQEPDTQTSLSDNKPPAGGTIKSPDEARRSLWPAQSRFVLTSAQNNTHVHRNFLNALINFCADKDAQLLISRYSYNKAGWRNHGGTAQEEGTAAEEGMWYDPATSPYFINTQVKLAPDLVFCGEVDIMPTAANPLTGMLSYTGHNSGIVPHAKMHMESIPTMKHQEPRFMYTTGTVTQRNYIKRKAGQVATFHHTFGALYVEVAEDGTWFCRQLIADDNGMFFHLADAYGPGWIAKASEFGRSSIMFGDLHSEKIDWSSLDNAIELANEIDAEWIVTHDVLDFKSQNHHNFDDPWFRAKMARHPGVENVEENVRTTAKVLNYIRTRSTANVAIVRSNHDDALIKWLKNPKAASDGVNARYWHELNFIAHSRIKLGQSPDVFRLALEAKLSEVAATTMRVYHFVDPDASFVINGIEHGLHGHLGLNGARGSPAGFRKMGDKTNSGHTHSASIKDGTWVGGVTGKLDMDYNVGPSSWSHSHIITYPNGKRCMITERNGKWRP